MIVRIASTRAPKVNGVKRAVEKVIQHFQLQNIVCQFETVKTESGVSDTPKSIQELMEGAQRRAGSVFEKGKTDVSVGVEGGLFNVGEKVFLQSWTCVYDGSEFYFGSSGSIELPKSLAQRVFYNGEDLGIAIDTFSKQIDVRSNQGTFGILTNDLITREDSFELSAMNAFVPYLNKTLYH